MALTKHKYAAFDLPKESFPIGNSVLVGFRDQCLPTKRPAHPKQNYQNYVLHLDYGTAKFYKASRKSDKEPVLIKKIRNRTDSYEQTLVENEAVLSLLCTFGPNILHYHDVHTTRKNTWIVMELIEGCTVKELSTAVELKEEHVAFIAKAVVESLAWLHERHRAHRDMKNQNVMIRRDFSIVLMDFGYAIQHTLERPSDNTSVGSLLYMAPEVARGEDYKYKPDVWSLGIMLYELICGDPPLIGCTSIKETVTRLINSETPSIPAYHVCGDSARDFVNCCLAIDPTRRASAASLLHHPFLALACSQAEWASLISTNLPTWPDVIEDEPKAGL
eukprot:c4789_g1_i2.p1 GENE.c4789_g1_i2~~c4789_g1_i2.p1  ORF type:complete len:332 (+),score=50.20 c4789_g1_i2:246-1241(+)